MTLLHKFLFTILVLYWCWLIWVSFWISDLHTAPLSHTGNHSCLVLVPGLCNYFRLMPFVLFRSQAWALCGKMWLLGTALQQLSMSLGLVGVHFSTQDPSLAAQSTATTSTPLSIYDNLHFQSLLFIYIPWSGANPVRRTTLHVAIEVKVK